MLLAAGAAHAAAPGPGFTRLPRPDGGPTTVFYPSADAERPALRGPFHVSFAAGDIDLDRSTPGPASWRKRPRDVSQAIDLVAANAPRARSHGVNTRAG